MSYQEGLTKLKERVQFFHSRSSNNLVYTSPPPPPPPPPQTITAYTVIVQGREVCIHKVVGRSTMESCALSFILFQEQAFLFQCRPSVHQVSCKHRACAGLLPVRSMVIQITLRDMYTQAASLPPSHNSGIHVYSVAN